MTAPTLLTPYGYSASTCGYCSPSGQRSSGPSSKSYGLEARQMSCQFYQNMIDRGWRRSGNYVYHPDMDRTCCPQYTIRLDAGAFKPNKKQRQVMNRWNRYLEDGAMPGEAAAAGKATSTQGKGSDKGKGKSKGKSAQSEEWTEGLKAFELGWGTARAHKFETILTPAKATPETFELYRRYQIAVHKDKPDKVSMRGFERFLCDSPLGEADIRYRPGSDQSRLPKKYGSYHLLYRVDGELVGISVIDILPCCVSSVYFIWHPDWAWASLGKLSALREIALVRDMSAAGAEGMDWLYMGYWIANCQKMRYKSEYEPSYLLDPGTNAFHLLTVNLDQALQAKPPGYRPFDELAKAANSPATSDRHDSSDVVVDDPDDDMDDEAESNDEDEGPSSFPDPPPPGFADPDSFSEADLDDLLVYRRTFGFGKRGSSLVKLGDLQFSRPDFVHREIRELLAAVGKEGMASAKAGLEGLGDRGIIFLG